MKEAHEVERYKSSLLENYNRFIYKLIFKIFYFGKLLMRQYVAIGTINITINLLHIL